MFLKQYSMNPKYLLFFLIISTLALSGCKTKYQKLLESRDFATKYDKAIEFYESKKYVKALPLLEELVGIYRGSAKGEKVNYLYAYCNYNLKDLYSAAFHFKNFSETYANSQFAEECRFMSAYCLYRRSPKFSLDQTETIKAIEAFQLFANLYPYSDRVSKCNEYIDLLRNKLERKAFENAKTYYTIGEYRSAVISFENAIEDFPDSKYIEEMWVLSIQANYEYAHNSVRSKKEERYRETITTYLSFIDKFRNEQYISDAQEVYSTTVKELENFLQNNPSKIN
ncbi:MAG: outer membrane protein assembly factor BamD [Sphingobacteriales bacterium]|jgi:outer membrane protein assembly factor BamD